MATLYLNIVTWASKSTDLGIKIVADDAGTVSWLQNQGYTDVTFHSTWENTPLTEVDLLICQLDQNASAAELNTLTSYALTGGGLVVSAYSELWNHDSSTTNSLFRNCGLGWASGFSFPTGKGTDVSLWPLIRSTDMGNARITADVAADLNAFTEAQQEETGQALEEAGVVLPYGSPPLSPHESPYDHLPQKANS